MSASAVSLIPSPAPQVEHPPAEPEPRSALLNIQALRALAAFMVVFVHLEALAMMAGAHGNLFEAGNAGVDIFFVISGFIMVFTTARKPVGPAVFFVSRIKRIAPLYWLATFAVFAVAAVAPALLQGTHSGARPLLDSLLFIPFQRPDGAVRPLVFVGWTLNYEMAFYALFAAGLMLRRRTLGVLLVFGALAGTVLWGHAIRPAGVLGAYYSRPIVLEFGFGMLLGLAWPRLNARPWALGLAIAAAPLAVAAILAAPIFWPGQDRALASGLPALALVWSALIFERARRTMRWRWIQVLGNASYATYLSHAFVCQGVILLGTRAGLTGPASAFALGAITLLAVAATGVTVHYAVERPMAAALTNRKAGREVTAPIEVAPAKVG